MNEWLGHRCGFPPTHCWGGVGHINTIPSSIDFGWDRKHRVFLVNCTAVTIAPEASHTLAFIKAWYIVTGSKGIAFMCPP